MQRFGEQVRAFENVCAHRSFPLRTADKGNGPVVCGFHHWQYDGQGRAIGIPQCQELFGTTPQALSRHRKIGTSVQRQAQAARTAVRFATEIPKCCSQCEYSSTLWGTISGPRRASDATPCVAYR